MKPTFGSAYLDDNLTQFTTIHCILFMLTEAMISTGHYLKRVVINIRASNNISGLVKVSVTSPAGLIKFFLNVELCIFLSILYICRSVADICTGLDGPQKDQVVWRGYLNQKSGSPASILGSPAISFFKNVPFSPFSY